VNELPAEAEVKLLIVSDNSARLADEIASLTHLDGYILISRDEEHLYDTYWDRTDGKLGNERVAMRLRRTDTETLVTLKGPTKKALDGTDVRMEIEELWSPAAFDTIRILLGNSDLWPIGAKFDAYRNDPFESLRNAGFVIVQRRETSRLPRDLIVENGHLPQTRIAELVIDTTVFQVGLASVLNREVEVESKGPGGREAVNRASHTLLNLYPESLKRSKHSKIAMGKAIDAIINKLRSEDGVTSDGSLSAMGHRLIDEYSVSVCREHEPVGAVPIATLARVVGGAREGNNRS